MKAVGEYELRRWEGIKDSGDKEDGMEEKERGGDVVELVSWQPAVRLVHAEPEMYNPLHRAKYKTVRNVNEFSTLVVTHCGGVFPQVAKDKYIYREWARAGGSSHIGINLPLPFLIVTFP